LEARAVEHHGVVDTNTSLKAVGALFVGDGPLVIQCLDAFIAAGGSAVALVTKDDTLHAQAAERGVRVIAKSASLNEDVSALVFDYLFSIANLDMLPDALIGSARKMAVNFHDGPLPHYAGLNATSWAILNGETSHGVTWHEMTAKADMGGIVSAESVSIDPNETALSLNAKCFEAGLAGFRSIIKGVAAGGLQACPQQGDRSYFGREKRPTALATVAFDAPAAQTLALVRALTFGPYANPLSFAKLWTGERLLFVGAAEVADVGVATPGTVLAVDAQSVTIATADAPIKLSDLTSPAGEAFDPSKAADLRVGAVLPLLSADCIARIDQLGKASAKSEAFWLAHSARAQVIEQPYPRVRRAGAATHEFALVQQGRAEEGVAALAAWAARVTGARSISLAIFDGTLEADFGYAALWFARWRPLVIDMAVDIDGADLVGGVETTLAAARAAGPLTNDFYVRRARQDRARGRAEDLSFAVAIGAHAPQHPNADITLRVVDGALSLCIRGEAFELETARTIADHVGAALRALTAMPKQAIADIELRDANESARQAAFDIGPVINVPFASIQGAIARQAAATPDRIAVRTRWAELSYATLEQRATRVAAQLTARGVKPGDVVGVRMERSVEMVVALLAVLKAGGAYTPLDPAYPSERLAFMVKDCRARFVIADSNGPIESGLETLALADLDVPAQTEWRAPEAQADSLAYLIYTSGSTGKPKGVKVHHGAVANFFAGMDARIPHDDPGVWLAVTSPNFDISVLELFWTLARGFTVALHVAAQAGKAERPDFSLFYFGASSQPGGNPYKLLLEGARFADENGFEAVWTPERHFHHFGGAYPNPAITSAAIASITHRVKIRAGSCVLPLHHPIRVAEDWSVIDNISGGRVGLAFATGWQPNDFVLAPDAFAQRKDVLMKNMEVVRRLWRGESIEVAAPGGKTSPTRVLPRPVQADLPIWLTVARNPETFEAAGANGLNVLTHMLGMGMDELAGNVALYRAARAKAGYAGEGRVTLMLHAFAGACDDSVREIVRAPMKSYLSSSIDLVRDAAWSFPTFIQKSQETGKTPKEIFEAEPLQPDELDALLDHAFERYFKTSGLFGSIETCVEMVSKVKAIGINEIACLVDFGVDTDTALAHLPYLRKVMDAAEKSLAPAQRYTVAEDIRHFNATHLQCTPSMALMLAGDADVAAMQPSEGDDGGWRGAAARTRAGVALSRAGCETAQHVRTD
jgi:natural product biosynthesis luciferase-like monooxygenase protein